MNVLLNSILCVLIISINFCAKKEEEPGGETKNVTVPRLIFLGDSLTAGMGLGSVEESYANLLHKRLMMEGYSYELVNAGVSGDTSSGGLTRLDWVLSKGVDVFVLELGANDMMRGLPIKEVYTNLKKIITLVRDKFPDVKILLIPMKPFPNMGKDYGKKFEAIYPQLGVELNVKVSKFLLENVAGIPELNQKDGIHPTGKGHEIMAENIYYDLKSILTTAK